MVLHIAALPDAITSRLLASSDIMERELEVSIRGSLQGGSLRYSLFVLGLGLSTDSSDGPELAPHVPSLATPLPTNQKLFGLAHQIRVAYKQGGALVEGCWLYVKDIHAAVGGVAASLLGDEG